MVYTSSLLKELLQAIQILGPAGLVNLGVIYLFLRNKLTLAQGIYSLLAPIVIIGLSTLLASRLIPLLFGHSNDGLGELYPTILLALIFSVIGLYFFYRNFLGLGTGQMIWAIFAMILSVPITLWVINYF